MKIGSVTCVGFATLLLLVASCSTPPPPAPAPPAPVAVAPVPAPELPKFVDMVTNEPLPLTIKTFYPNGDPSGTVTSTYNETGQLLTQETTNANGTVVETRAGKAKGELWRVTVTNAQTGELLSFEDSSYSPEGDLLTQTNLSPKEIPLSSNEYTWQYGNKTQWVTKLGATLAVQSKAVYLYDADGRNTRVEVYDAGNNLLTTFESQYDASGHLLVRKGVDAKETLVEQVNFTWKGDQKVKEETLKPLLRTLEFTYSDSSTAPATINTSVRGRLVERQVRTYLWIKYTHRVPNKERK